MKHFYLILFITVIGCGSMTDKTEKLAVKQTMTTDFKNVDKGNNSYSGDPLDNFNPIASGNSTIIINVGKKEKRIEKNEKRDTTTDQETSESFSIDYYVRSVPLTGWILILVLVLALGVGFWIFLKTTMIGKALDASISAGLKLTRESIDIVRDKLAQAERGSDLHSDLSAELSRLRKKEGDLQLKRKHQKGRN